MMAVAKRGRPPVDQDKARVSGISARLTMTEREFCDQLVDELLLTNDTELIGVILRGFIRRGIPTTIDFLYNRGKADGENSERE
jgi:hypothetical protein